MHSAQSSEAIAAHILSTLSEFESDHQNPNTASTEESVHNLGWDPSDPTLVHEQNAYRLPALFTIIHNRSPQTFMIILNRIRRTKILPFQALFTIVHNHSHMFIIENRDPITY